MQVTTAAAALSVQNITKRYTRRRPRWTSKIAEDGTHALRDVSFTVREGEVLGLLGPNGAGKTTLLKIISTMLYPDSGTVSLFGQDILHRPDESRRKMGLVTSDERSFYWRLSGRQNLRFFAALYGLPKQLAASRIDNLFETLGLSQAADRPFHGYSSGMKQKMAIARGLLADPAVVMYDEPTRALDPLSARTIRQWIIHKRLESPRQTHLIATNLMHEAEQLCDRVLIISRGSVIALGSIAEIRQRSTAGTAATHRITCRGNLSEALNGPDEQSGIFSVSTISRKHDTLEIRVHTDGSGQGLSQVLRWILDSGAEVVRCESEEPTFDELFCTMVHKDNEGAVALQ
jgi:ABC-2 type transport system ATP-binding protein